ncbi:MAG: hypothetical protein M0Z46_21695 [Actinomycetota bacterium]|nr:hypothetical protein [Actinomycetota bacterium]
MGSRASSRGEPAGGKLAVVFERFTNRGWHVLVLAQEEAGIPGERLIETEHILLALLRESDGLAAQALTSLGVSLDDARWKVPNRTGSALPPTGRPPFSPDAKMVLELSLREAVRLGHNGIDTEHLLLGLVRQEQSAPVEMLRGLGTDLQHVRGRVLSLISRPDYVPNSDGANAGKAQL